MQSYAGPAQRWYWTATASCSTEGPCSQRTVLDQGFYPDGIYTAPSEDVGKRHSSFDGPRALTARAYMKRFLRSAFCTTATGWAIWCGASSPTRGLDVTRPDAMLRVLPEWLEEVERDFNHPAP